jgi:preprotein translocase subunit SecA
VQPRRRERQDEAYETKVANWQATSNIRQFERSMLLQSLDSHWREHLAAMDHLRQGIHLRGYAAKNPKQEYKREAFELFERMLETIAHEVSQVTLTVQIRSEADVEAVAPQDNLTNVQYQHAPITDAALAEGEAASPAEAATMQPIERQYAKVGRNDACPCGSGKKFKHCHGKLA